MRKVGNARDALRLASLTTMEREFVAEMAHEPSAEWSNFDPPFLRKEVIRFERWGWLETRNKGFYAEHRWTDAGRRALAEAGKEAGRG